jgi:hypothetical protein
LKRKPTPVPHLGFNQFREHRTVDQVTVVLDAYHELIREERSKPRESPWGGRDGGLDRRMRAVGPETGQLVNIIAKSLQAPSILELGTSFGYSGIRLAEAAWATGGRLTTMELHDYRSAYARETAIKASLAGQWQAENLILPVAGWQVRVGVLVSDFGTATMAGTSISIRTLAGASFGRSGHS